MSVIPKSILRRDAEVIIFDNSQKGRPVCNHKLSQLKDFLLFLKCKKLTPALKFSHIGPRSHFINKLTLGENLNLVVSHGLSTASIEGRLAKPEFQNLKALYQQILFTNKLTAEASFEEQKIIAIVIALLSNANIILIEYPELSLSHETQQLFLKAVKEHMTRSDCSFFFNSPQSQAWSALATKRIYRGSKGHFLEDPIINDSNVIPFRKEELKTSSESSSYTKNNTRRVA